MDAEETVVSSENISDTEGMATSSEDTPDTEGALDGFGSANGDSFGEGEIETVYDMLLDVFQVEWLSGVLTIVVALAFTAFVAHASTKLLRRVLSHDNSPLPSSSIFVNISRVVIWIIGFSIILDNFFDVQVSSLITALGIGGIAISLGFQDTLSNLIGGLQLSIMSILQPGDHIQVGSNRGVVTDVTWRHTTIRDFSGSIIVIPNSVINTSALVKLPPVSKVVVPISVTTEGNDLDVLSVAIQKASDAAVAAITPVISPTMVVFTSITEFGFAANAIVYVEDGMQVNAVKDAVVRATASLTRPHEITAAAQTQSDPADEPKAAQK